MDRAQTDGGSGVGDDNKRSKAPGKRPAKPAAPTPQPSATAQSIPAEPTVKAAAKPTVSSSAAATGYKPSKPATPVAPIAESPSPKSTPPSAGSEKSSPKRGIPNSALALAAVVIGLGVGFLTYGFGSAADRTPTARVQMVLDEDQTGWPFYAAVQEEAVAQVEASETQQAVRAALSQPDSATDLWVDRPGDLSVFAIYATAASDEVALEFATAAAAELQARNVSQRRSGEEATLAQLQTQLAELEARVAESSAALDGSDEESERVIAREDLRIASADRADTQQAITDLETEIAAIAPAFRPAAPAAIQSTGSRSILAAVASAAAAAALTLLALSFVAPNRDDS